MLINNDVLKFEEKLMPYLTALSKFRDDVRNEAKQTKRTDFYNRKDRNLNFSDINNFF